MENKWKKFLFYTTIFLLCLALTLMSKNYDFDLWARLIVGMKFFETGSIFKYDFLSYTPTHTWYDHEWGSSVAFYFVYKLFGHNGFLILQVLLLFFTIVFALKTVKLICENKYSPYNVLIYFIVINTFLSTYSNLIRCHSFSFLFFTITLYILELARRGKSKLLIILPFLAILWNNMHGGVVSGLGLIVLFAIGEFLNKKSAKPFIITAICSFLVLLINPYGIDYLKFLFMAVTMKRPYIVEWWSIFHKVTLYKFITFKIFALFLLVVELIKVIREKFSYTNLDKTKFLVLAATLWQAVMHIKMMPFFAITACIYIYPDICKIFEKINFPKWSDKALYITFILYSSAILFTKDLEPMINFKFYPVREVEFIKINNLEGKLLTNFGYGSFSAYKLYPHNKIYMDGRYEEVYDDYILEDLQKAYTMAKDWDNLFKKNPPDVIIVEKFYPLYKHLEKDPSWSRVFTGTFCGVFVRTENKKSDYKIPSDEINYYRKNLFDTDISFK